MLGLPLGVREETRQMYLMFIEVWPGHHVADRSKKAGAHGSDSGFDVVPGRNRQRDDHFDPTSGQPGALQTLVELKVKELSCVGAQERSGTGGGRRG